jgi:hypothetical protein
VPLLAAGAPESPPGAAVPGGEQAGLAAPPAAAAGLAADPAATEHDAPDECTGRSPSEGVVALATVGVSGESVVVVGEGGEAVVGEDDAVPAPEAVPAEQAVDRVGAPPVAGSDAVV